MEENIEVKDVQKTEYLDKNGLDMLWAKVKENTNNQVEEEYNRAQAVEGDITNKLDNLKYMPYVSKTNMNSTELGDFVKYQLGATEFTISAQHGSNDARTEFGFGEVDFISVSKKSSVSIDYNRVTIGDDNNIKLTNTGIRKYTNNHNPAGSATEAFSTDGGIIDTTVFALKSKLAAKADTTALTALEQKVTANTTAIKGKQDAGNYITFEKRGLNEDRAYIIKPSYYIECRTSEFDNGKYNYSTMSGQSINVTNASGKNVRIYSEGITIKDSGNASNSYNLSLGNSNISSYSNSPSHSLLFSLNKYGVKLEGGSNNRVLTSNGSTINITEYAKKTDIPEVDTSDFVNKNADEAQIINSPLAFTNEVVIASDMEDENTDYVALAPTKLQFSENNYTSSIELNGKDTDVNAECSIEINADHRNPLISLYSGNTDNGNDDSALEITNSGISISNSQNENIGPDKVFATNGSIADLAQYVKKSEITADGNVDDVQVNGVSVVENKVANIKPATKEKLGVVKVGDGLNVTDGVISVSAGNYLTYDSMVNEQYYISSPKSFIFNGRNVQDSSSSISNDCIIVSNNNAHMYSKMLDNYIELRADKNALNISCANITGNEYKGDDPTPYQQFVLNKQGVWLYGGDDNHVLTSNASTIDITQYALKSVYDEKIAALEARIAALEAKHVEV